MSAALYESRSACPTLCGRGHRVAAWARKLSPRRFLRAQRWRTELNDMTDVELRDIGLSRCQIGAVVNGTFSR